MWCRIVVCVVLSGCGFRASAVPGDDAGSQPPDSAVQGDGASPGDSAAIDTMPAAPDCWQHWLDHAPSLGGPSQITELATSSSERDPWISMDGLRMYFDRITSGASSDVYFTSRTAVNQPFMTPAVLTNLSPSDTTEGRPALNRDETMLVLSSDRGSSHNFDIYIITRSNMAIGFGSPNQDHLGSVNSPGNSADRYDPFLTGDGLKIYLAPAPRNGGNQHISVATRTAVTADFGTPMPLSVNTTENAGDADPAVSPDDRVIVFSSNRSGGVGGVDLYYATRTDVTQSFGSPIRIPTVNSSADDGDPMLSSDGCELYFASTRSGGSGGYDLYIAHVMK